MPESRAAIAARLDLIGAALLSVILLAVLLALVEGSDHSWPLWTVIVLIAGLLAGGTTALVERAVERRGDVPLLPPLLLRRRAVRIGLALTLAFYASNAGLFVVLTFFLQDGLQVSPVTAGLTFAPLGLAFTAASLLSRRRSGGSGSSTMIVGSCVMVVALAAGILVARAGGETEPSALTDTSAEPEARLTFMASGWRLRISRLFRARTST